MAAQKRKKNIVGLIFDVSERPLTQNPPNQDSYFS